MQSTAMPLVLGLGLLACAPSSAPPSRTLESPAVIPDAPTRYALERVSTAVPFPRGLALVDGRLYALARGRVRDYGGVSAAIDDQAGTIYEVDPAIAEPATASAVSPAVEANARVVAAPTSPPFLLWDRAADPPWSDRLTDRPYCALRYDPASANFFVCAFSGIDKAKGNGSTFSKNLSDALFRYDTRAGRWFEVERHDIEAGGSYPHHDPAVSPPPHGWLNGPDNCLVVGRWLYAVAKDNSRLVRYDLAPIAADPAAPPPPSTFVLGDEIAIRGHGTLRFSGHSMLGAHDGWLYVGFRTSSEVIRIPLGADGLPVEPIEGELLARFDPYDPVTRKSANLTDLSIGPDGHVYVISATPARVYRFFPDPARPYDARGGAAPPLVDLAAATGNPRMKSENLLVDDAGRIYVTSGDAYTHEPGSGGVIWRLVPQES